MSQVILTEDRSVTSVLLFPQEITDMIIDFLHDDVESLLACALVSRSWLPASRFHLFGSCTIKGATEFQTAFRTITMTPDVGSYVRALTIVNQGMRGLTLGTFETLLSGLPDLRSLTIQRVRFKNNTTGMDRKNASFLQNTRPTASFALEELKLLECNVTKADYSLLLRVLGLFSSIQTLFLTSTRTARWLQSDPEDGIVYWGIEPAPRVHRVPHWEIEPAPRVHIVVEHLHAFDIPPPVMQALMTTFIAANALRTLWYDDDTIDWPPATWVPSPEIDQFGQMLASLTSRRLILGPLPIFENASELRRGLARLQLGSVSGLHTFHLRGRWLEPHIADVFAGLPDTVRDARFVLIGVSGNATWGVSRNRFRAFAEAFAPVLGKPERALMSFTLDLGVAKRKLPEENFAVLKQRAETGLLGHGLVGEGRMRIEDSPEEM
ncbi:hypothetical protein V8D89_006297 [Ganoderma adspersum]